MTALRLVMMGIQCELSHKMLPGDLIQLTGLGKVGQLLESGQGSGGAVVQNAGMLRTVDGGVIKGKLRQHTLH